MGSVSTWRSPEAKTRYLALYDRTVESSWPVAKEEIDVATTLGVTRVRRSGDAGGTPVVMLHPTTGSSAGWYPVIAAMSATRTVFTPDTVGAAGRSVQTAPVTSADQLVTWLDEVLDGLGLDRVHLLGYSEGGWIAGTYAGLTDRRSRVASLVLVEPAGLLAPIPPVLLVELVLRGMRVLAARDKPAAIRRFNRWMNGDVELTDEQVELILAAMGSFRQRLPSPSPLADDALAAITAPTLLLMGSDTKLLPPSVAADRAGRLIPDVTVELVADAGHGVLFQHPGRTTARILEFLARTTTRRSGHVAPSADPQPRTPSSNARSALATDPSR